MNVLVLAITKYLFFFSLFLSAFILYPCTFLILFLHFSFRGVHSLHLRLVARLRPHFTVFLYWSKVIILEVPICCAKIGIALWSQSSVNSHQGCVFAVHVSRHGLSAVSNVHFPKLNGNLTKPKWFDAHSLTIHCIDERTLYTHRSFIRSIDRTSVEMYLCVCLSQGKLLKWYEMAKSHKLARVNACEQARVCERKRTARTSHRCWFLMCRVTHITEDEEKVKNIA